MADNGTERAMNSTAITTQVARQPMLPNNNWVMGRKKTPPVPKPLAAKARARPRLCWKPLGHGD